MFSLFGLLLTALMLAPGLQGGCPGAQEMVAVRQMPLGAYVTVQGHVTVPTGVFTPAQSFALQDATGGLYVYRAAGIAQSAALGDEFCVSGRLASYHGMLELMPSRVGEVRWLGSAGAPSAQPIAADALGEQSEGRLVSIAGEVTEIRSRSFVIDGAEVYLDEDAAIQWAEVEVGCQVTVSGLSADYDSPQLWPRFTSDLVSAYCPASECRKVTVSEIQGPGAVSPYAGQQIVGCLSACITGVAADGFFIQGVTPDADARTSEGMFVYRHPGWDNPRRLKAGDLVELQGFGVQEFYGSTELTDLRDDSSRSIVLLGSCQLPAPVSIPTLSDPNAEPDVSYEMYEGMRVALSFSGTAAGPTTRFPSRFATGEPEIAILDRRSPLFGGRVFARALTPGRGLVHLSGGLGINLPDVSTGDVLSADDLTGILAYRFGRFVLLVDDTAQEALRVSAAPKRDAAEPPAIGPDEFGICSFNVENLFDHLDDGDGDVGDWSPLTADDFRRRVEQRAAAIRSFLPGCSVIGLQEMEGKEAVWQALSAAVGGYSYDYFESADERDITAGILYDPARVQLRFSQPVQRCVAEDFGVDEDAARGPRARSSGCRAGAFPLFTRPPYLAELIVSSVADQSNVELTLIVSHLKSKRGDEADNIPLRLAQADAVADTLAQVADRQRLAAAVGDFNDDLFTPTLQRFDGFVNLYLAHLPAAEWYSFVFNGRSEALDHFVMSNELDRLFRSGALARINADYPDALAPNASAQRSSDHDPIFVRFGFRPTGVTDALAGAACGVALGQAWQLDPR